MAFPRSVSTQLDVPGGELILFSMLDENEILTKEPPV